MFVTGQMSLPKIDQAWCDAAYWFHEGLANSLDTVATVKLETAVEVLLRSESSKGSGKRMRQAIEAVTGLTPKAPIALGSSVTVEQFAKTLVGARSQVLHGTFSTLTEELLQSDRVSPDSPRTCCSLPSHCRSTLMPRQARPATTSKRYFGGLMFSVHPFRPHPRRESEAVIGTLADLLGELARVEADKLAQSDIKHPTLIGGMYEGCLP